MSDHTARVATAALARLNDLIATTHDMAKNEPDQPGWKTVRDLLAQAQPILIAYANDTIAPQGQHAIVELPTAETDEMGYLKWQVAGADKWSYTRLDERGRVASLGINNPLSADLAIGQAAALIAAAQEANQR
ncbi:hypothetical protein [Nocardia aurea]|uniref:hypothetical protein n=1 Tax=Nocardia aurea TaxID=2144174 RepID=UPI0033BBDA5B